MSFFTETENLNEIGWRDNVTQSGMKGGGGGGGCCMFNCVTYKSGQSFLGVNRSTFYVPSKGSVKCTEQNPNLTIFH